MVATANECYTNRGLELRFDEVVAESRSQVLSHTSTQIYIC